MTKNKKDKDVITKEEENNAAEYCRENNNLTSKLGYLTETIAYDMAERASQTFIKIVKAIGLDDAGRILSVMGECEPYVNVSILEAVFASQGEIDRAKDMAFLYDCAENAPGLFEMFHEYFMASDEIDGVMIELIVRPDAYLVFPGIKNGRSLREWRRQ